LDAKRSAPGLLYDLVKKKGFQTARRSSLRSGLRRDRKRVGERREGRRDGRVSASARFRGRTFAFTPGMIQFPGTGDMSTVVAAAVRGRIAPHVNVGYQWNGDSAIGGQGRGGKKKRVYNGGFDVRVTRSSPWQRYSRGACSAQIEGEKKGRTQYSNRRGFFQYGQRSIGIKRNREG